MRFEPSFPVTALRPAPYNPRRIDEAGRESLQESIRALGFCKPVIALEDGLIVAGHQRTEAARALGLTSVPAVLLEGFNAADEILFNQLHNGTDVEDAEHPVRVPESAVLGFADVLPDAVTVEDDLVPGAVIRQEIGNLILRYGNWGAAVATASGRVVSSPQYVRTCRTLRIPSRVFYIPDNLEETARACFARAYGSFCYDHIERTSYLQSFAQPLRLREPEHENHGSKRAEGRSWLYDHLVIPELREGDRVLDFGCGQGDYAALLQRRGVNIRGLEFFRRYGGRIDTRAVHRLVQGVLAELDERGRYDVVVCNHVVNSVDSTTALEDVLVCAVGLCRPGGRIYLSGRLTDWLETQTRMVKNVSNQNARRYVKFLDANGFTANYMKGGWFFQLFHTREQATQLCRRWIGPAARVSFVNGCWWSGGVKQVEPDRARMEQALRREFDLPWPEGQRVGRAEEAVHAWRAAMEREPGPVSTSHASGA